MGYEYRERIYIIKDIILKLTEYGELSQTALISYCGLNLTKHKHILDSMESKGLIAREEAYQGNKKVTKYKVTPKGLEFCKMILEPYEELFPRRGYVNKKDTDIINKPVSDRRKGDDNDENAINIMLLLVITYVRLTMLTKCYIARRCISLHEQG